MSHIFKLLLIVLVFLGASCKQNKGALPNNNITITGSGTLVSQERTLTGFDTVEAGLHFDLVIHQGEDSNVVITADDNFVDYIAVEQVGTTISFGLRSGYAYNIYDTTMQATVTMPEVAGLFLNGSSHAELDGLVDVARFEAELTGSSSLTGELEADSANLNVYGNAYVKLAGSGKKLGLDACGNSVSDLSEFRVEDATIDLSCASMATVNVDGRLDGEASQNARIFHAG